MTFWTALRQIVVGLVGKPWRLLWIILVAMGAVWLTDRADGTSIAGLAARIVINAVAVALSAPAVVDAFQHQPCRRRDVEPG
jgi:quinol-cytochrome oxidoreductase complex cytochrome b subunit